MEIKNIFITGKPGCGKTSLIMEIIKEENLDAGGFYAQEIRERGRRQGFAIVSLDDNTPHQTCSGAGQEGVLAHKDFQSSYKIGKYGINLKNLEEIGMKAILKALKENKLVIIDEIGKMEMISEKFKKAVETALDSKNKVLGTIKLTPDSFVNKIKNREDTKIFYLNKESKNEIKREIISWLQSS